MTEPWPRERIEAELRELLREYVRRPERPIDPGDHLIFDLEIDDDDASFDFIPHVHRHFGIDPPAAAWLRAATFADTVELIERYQRAPPTPEERAQEEADRLRVRQFGRRAAAGLIAWIVLALALEVWWRDVGKMAFGAAMMLLFLTGLPVQLREGRRLRRERLQWKARRAAEKLIHERG